MASPVRNDGQTSLQLLPQAELGVRESVQQLERSQICDAFCLTDEIWIAYIVPLLDAPVVLRLRLVNRWSNRLLSKSHAWWTLWLRHPSVPIPSRLPASRVLPAENGAEHNQHPAFAPLDGLRAQRLVLRAHSLHSMWRQSAPDLKFTVERTFDAEYLIFESVLLPGGDFLVASACRGLAWYIIVYHLDGPCGFAPIVVYPTMTKASRLQARYVVSNGTSWMVVGWTRRNWVHALDAERGIDISDYSGETDIDPPFPVEHMCTVLAVPVNAAQDVAEGMWKRPTQERAASLPLPEEIVNIHSETPFGPLTLDEIGGKPYLMVVCASETGSESQDRILCCRLFTQAVEHEEFDGFSAIRLRALERYPDAIHKIRALRVLPQQLQVLVVRDIIDRQTATFHVAIELHDLRFTGIAYESCAEDGDRRVLADMRIAQAHITDHGIPHAEHIAASSASDDTNAFMPNPISIYLTTVQPHVAVARFVLYPHMCTGNSPPADIATDSNLQLDSKTSKNHACRPSQAYSHAYNLSDLPDRPLWIRSPDGNQLRVLPGSFRSLLLVVPQQTYGDHRPVLQILRLLDTQLLDWHPQTRRRRISECKAQGKISLDVEDRDHQVLPRMDEVEFKLPDRGNTYLGAFAWDEEMGRLCFTELGYTELAVRDFAYTPGTDAMEAERTARQSQFAQPEELRPSQVDEATDHTRAPVAPEVLDLDAGDQFNNGELLL